MFSASSCRHKLIVCFSTASRDQQNKTIGGALNWYPPKQKDVISIQGQQHHIRLVNCSNCICMKALTRVLVQKQFPSETCTRFQEEKKKRRKHQSPPTTGFVAAWSRVRATDFFYIQWSVKLRCWGVTFTDCTAFYQLASVTFTTQNIPTSHTLYRWAQSRTGPELTATTWEVQTRGCSYLYWITHCMVPPAGFRYTDTWRLYWSTEG